MRKSLRIIIPNFRAEDSFVDNVADTLQHLGHEVLTFPRPPRGFSNKWGRLGVELLHRFRPDTLTEQESWLLEQAKAFQPNLILTLTQQIKDGVLWDVKKRAPGVVTAAWWGDPTATMKGMGLLSDGWDAIFAKDPQLVEKFRRVGLNSHQLHEAYNPRWHVPFDEERSGSVVVVGNYYGFRQVLVSRLLDAGVEVELYGFIPPAWSLDEVRSRHSGRFLVKTAKSRVFSGASVNLNSMTITEGNALNCRAFEICGSGGFQIIERRPIVEECFEPGREVMCFDTVDDIIEAYTRVRSDETWWREIRKAGHQRALAHHTYEHRVKCILKLTGFAAD